MSILHEPKAEGSSADGFAWHCDNGVDDGLVLYTKK